MNIVILLEPLAKLQVVLILSLDELINVNILLDTVFLKSCLEHFIVLNPLVVKFCIPLHFFYVKCTWVNFVNDLAVNSCSSALLNFRELKLEIFIHPVEDDVFAH